MQLELNEQQRQTLVEALESYLSDLRYEIGDTDAMDFRDALKAKKATLETVLEMLRDTPA